jgi:hypothetical protein
VPDDRAGGVDLRSSVMSFRDEERSLDEQRAPANPRPRVLGRYCDRRMAVAMSVRVPVIDVATGETQ